MPAKGCRSTPPPCSSSFSEAPQAPAPPRPAPLPRRLPVAGRRAPRGRHCLVGDGRPRTGGEGQGGNRRLEVHRAADAHRLAENPPADRQGARRGSDHRRPPRRRSAVLHGQTARGLDRLGAGGGGEAGHHDQLGRDDRLADAGREVGERAQLPALHTGRWPAEGAAADHRDDEGDARVARAVHLRGSRNAVERRLPQPRRRHRQPAEVPRHGDLQGRHRQDPGLRPDVGEHESVVRDRRAAHPSRPDRSGHRRREDGGARRGRRRALARTRATRCSRACTFRACASCSSRTSRGR